jgi:hypothetical protein
VFRQSLRGYSPFVPLPSALSLAHLGHLYVSLSPVAHRRVESKMAGPGQTVKGRRFVSSSFIPFASPPHPPSTAPYPPNHDPPDLCLLSS